MGVERDGVNLAGVFNDRENSTKGIVRGVCFYNKRPIWSSRGEDWSRSEGILEGINGFMGLIIEIPRDTFMCKAGQQNNNAGVFRNETTIEIGKT